jgi:hypothetical protein
MQIAIPLHSNVLNFEAGYLFKRNHRQNSKNPGLRNFGIWYPGIWNLEVWDLGFAIGIWVPVCLSLPPRE